VQTRGARGMLASHLNILLSSFFGTQSLFSSVNNAEGCDVVLTWICPGSDADTDGDEEKSFQDEVDCSGINTSIRIRSTFHVCAIEFKDQRATPIDEWNRKFEALVSDRNIVWWLSSLFEDRFDVEFHIVLAGRE
jgi:hypothetical protein